MSEYGNNRYGASWHYKSKDTLCWDCLKCEGGCSWSRDFIPVEGWDATDDSRYDHGHLVEKYVVKSCPEFKYGHNRGIGDYKSAERIVIEVGQLLADDYRSAYKRYLIYPSEENESHLRYSRSGITDGILSHLDIDLESFISSLEHEVKRKLRQEKRRQKSSKRAAKK